MQHRDSPVASSTQAAAPPTRIPADRRTAVAADALHKDQQLRVHCMDGGCDALRSLLPVRASIPVPPGRLPMWFILQVSCTTGGDPFSGCHNPPWLLTADLIAALS